MITGGETREISRSRIRGSASNKSRRSLSATWVRKKMYLSRGSYLRTSAPCKWHFPRVLSERSSWLMLYHVPCVHVKNCITFSLYLSFFQRDIFPTISPAFLPPRNFHLGWGEAYRDEDNGGKRGDDNIVSRNSEIFCHVLVRPGTTKASLRVHLKRPPGISRANTKVKL